MKLSTKRQNNVPCYQSSETTVELKGVLLSEAECGEDMESCQVEGYLTEHLSLSREGFRFKEAPRMWT